MTATPPLVILAGNTVTTWDCLNQSESPFVFCPQRDRPLSDVAWNHNGQVLASCSAVSTAEQKHDNIVLSAAVSGSSLDSLQHNENWKRQSGAATSLSFGGKSRYLCIGDASGAVCLWDLKKKVRVRQFFHERQPSLQVSLDPTDTFVLSLSSQALHTYKLREGIPAGTWTPQSAYSFTKYGTSPLEPHITAVGTDDGSLMLYDITNLQKSVPFFGLSRRHRDKITSVSFSPTSDKLLASSSLDGTLQFFDKASGTLIEQVAKLSSGITDLSLNIDGVSCAVGTKAGEVQLFDLRRAGKAIASMYVEGAVKALSFSPPPKQKAGDTSATKGVASMVAPSSSFKLQNSDSEQQTSHFEKLRMQMERGASAQQTRKAGTLPSPQHQQFANNSQSMKASEGPSASHLGAHISSKNKYQSTGSPQKPGPKQTMPAYGVGSLELSNSTNEHQREDSLKAAPAVVNTEALREVVRDEIEKLHDDMEDSLRNLHMDMIKQFHQQSQELQSMVSQQFTVIEQLREENEQLKEENEFLKLNQNHQNHPPPHSHRKIPFGHGDNRLFGA